MKISCTRILEFDAAHRVVNHESKCATLHGHRYKVETTATSADLDSIGRVIDFSVLKQKLGGWLDREWDHNSIIFKKDQLTIQALTSIPRKKEPFISEFNPTAENMAHFLLNTICPILFLKDGIIVTHIRVWETPNCFADAFLEVKP
jgi:6-pyruvoyltetrahydropterin/6-carboxytetrahydropterin synthase